SGDIRSTKTCLSALITSTEVLPVPGPATINVGGCSGEPTHAACRAFGRRSSPKTATTSASNSSTVTPPLPRALSSVADLTSLSHATPCRASPSWQESQYPSPFDHPLVALSLRRRVRFMCRAFHPLGAESQPMKHI